jgi:IS30 family transposase
MSGYTQLAQEQRYQIEALLKAGHNQTEIARVLGVDKSTISRELKRNRGLRGYRPKQAQRLTDNRRKEKVQPRITRQTWDAVEQLLREDWSPEQISAWLVFEKALHVSHEWIYLYVYEEKRQGGDLHLHLRCQKARRKRYGSSDRRGQLKGRVSIDERPAIVEERSRIGDWEIDTVIGKPGGAVLVTLAERKTRLSLIALARDKTAEGDSGTPNH